VRVGLGFDVHRFAVDRELVLAGVRIPSPVGLLGHSDADVIAHALMDALLGALALGDIGLHFPDTDERWRGVSSMVLLSDVMEKVRARGYRVVNVDIMVMCERPKIGPHRSAMTANLAQHLQVSQEDVSIKATTMEHLGFVGREEGAVAQAVALLERSATGAFARDRL
jgi:2-C-methyl-D-erythritol 2,4-cyclodiphosphate synthase